MISLLLATSLVRVQSDASNFQIGTGSPPELAWLSLIGKTKTDIYNLHRSGKLVCKDIRGEYVLRDDYSLAYEIAMIRIRDKEGALPRPDNYKYLRIDAQLTFDALKDAPRGKVSEILVNSVNAYYSSEHTQGRGYAFPIRAHLRHIYITGPLLASRITAAAFEREIILNTDLANTTGTVKRSFDYPYPWTIIAPFGADHVVKVNLSTSGPWLATSTYDPETRRNKLSVSPYSTSTNPFLDSSIESIRIFQRSRLPREFSFESSSDPNWIETVGESLSGGAVRLPSPDREPFALTPNFLKGWRDMFVRNSGRVDRAAFESRPSGSLGAVSKSTSKPVSSAAKLSDSWLVILATDSSSAQVQATKRRLDKTVRGIKVASTKEFKLLKPGLWIAYLGPYPNREATESLVKMLKAKNVAHYVKRGK